MVKQYNRELTDKVLDAYTSLERVEDLLGRDITDREGKKQNKADYKKAVGDGQGVSAYAVDKILLGRERFTTKLNDFQKETLYRNFEKGENRKKLAEKYSISKSHVYDIAYEIMHQKKDKIDAKEQEILYEDLEEIVELDAYNGKKAVGDGVVYNSARKSAPKGSEGGRGSRKGRAKGVVGGRTKKGSGPKLEKSVSEYSKMYNIPLSTISKIVPQFLKKDGSGYDEQALHSHLCDLKKTYDKKQATEAKQADEGTPKQETDTGRPKRTTKTLSLEDINTVAAGGVGVEKIVSGKPSDDTLESEVGNLFDNLEARGEAEQEPRDQESVSYEESAEEIQPGGLDDELKNTGVEKGDTNEIITAKDGKITSKTPGEYEQTTDPTAETAKNLGDKKGAADRLAATPEKVSELESKLTEVNEAREKEEKRIEERYNRYSKEIEQILNSSYDARKKARKFSAVSAALKSETHPKLEKLRIEANDYFVATNNEEHAAEIKAQRASVPEGRDPTPPEIGSPLETPPPEEVGGLEIKSTKEVPSDGLKKLVEESKERVDESAGTQVSAEPIPATVIVPEEQPEKGDMYETQDAEVSGDDGDGKRGRPVPLRSYQDLKRIRENEPKKYTLGDVVRTAAAALLFGGLGMLGIYGACMLEPVKPVPIVKYEKDPATEAERKKLLVERERLQAEKKTLTAKLNAVQKENATLKGPKIEPDPKPVPAFDSKPFENKLQEAGEFYANNHDIRALEILNLVKDDTRTVEQGKRYDSLKKLAELGVEKHTLMMAEANRNLMFNNAYQAQEALLKATENDGSAPKDLKEFSKVKDTIENKIESHENILKALKERYAEKDWQGVLSAYVLAQSKEVGSNFKSDDTKAVYDKLKIGAEEAIKLASAKPIGPEEFKPSNVADINSINSFDDFKREYKKAAFNMEAVSTMDLAMMSELGSRYLKASKKWEDQRVARASIWNLNWLLGHRFEEISRDGDLKPYQQLIYLNAARRLAFSNYTSAAWKERAPDLKKSMKKNGTKKVYHKEWAELLDLYELRDENNRFRWSGTRTALKTLTPLFVFEHLRNLNVHRDNLGIPGRRGLEEKIENYAIGLAKIANQRGWTSEGKVLEAYRNQVNNLGNYSLREVQAVNELIDASPRLKKMLDRDHHFLLANKHYHEEAVKERARGDNEAAHANYRAALVLTGQDSTRESMMRFLEVRQEAEDLREYKDKETLEEIVTIPYGDESFRAKLAFYGDLVVVVKDGLMIWGGIEGGIKLFEKDPVPPIKTNPTPGSGGGSGGGGHPIK